MDAADNEGFNPEEYATDSIAAQEAVPLVGDIVSSVCDLPVARVTPLVGMGAVNLIYFVETPIGEIVVRLNKPEDSVAKVRGDYEKEQWCIERASGAGVPGPEVLAVGEFAGRAFMLQKRVIGVNGKQSGREPVELLRVLGRYARLIHSIPTSGFGDSVEGFESGKAQEGWMRFVDYNLGELTDTDPLIALGVYIPEQQNAIREMFLWLRSLPLRIGLNHGDLARRNTIVDEAGQVTLLDWGCAEMHVVPHYDLYGLLHWYSLDHGHLRAFLEGYGISEAEWGRLIPEVNAIVLLKAFDLTRWAIARCPERTIECAARAHERLGIVEDARNYVTSHTLKI